ncbi:hypothetical protein ACFQV2_10425 [Actinokineospora soli]|uniref:SCO6045-like C-terminal domain-containing protein n=1 Tax=Actinokineospora soli TaxID=1048753 RepID=A0ABW2TJG6_9PSEU
MSARDDLARDQAALLAALLADGTPPPGFDERMLAVEARALLNKRRRVNALLDPDTAAELGERYRELFDTWAASNPRKAGTRARADAAAFREWALPSRKRRWFSRR